MEKNLFSFHFGFSHVLELGRILKGEKMSLNILNTFA